MPEFVRIENVKYGTYLAVDRRKIACVVLKEYNGNDKYQQWTEIERRGGIEEEDEDEDETEEEEEDDDGPGDDSDDENGERNGGGVYPVFNPENYGEEYRDFYLLLFNPETGYPLFNREDPDRRQWPRIYARLRELQNSPDQSRGVYGFSRGVYRTYYRYDFTDECREYYLRYFDRRTGYPKLDRSDPHRYEWPRIYAGLRNVQRHGISRLRLYDPAGLWWALPNDAVQRSRGRVFGTAALRSALPNYAGQSTRQSTRQRTTDNRAKSYFYKNVGTGGFLCVDPSRPERDKLKALVHAETTWVVEARSGKNTIRLLHDTTKYIKADKSVNRVRVQEFADNNKFLWKITSASED